MELFKSLEIFLLLLLVVIFGAGLVFIFRRSAHREQSIEPEPLENESHLSEKEILAGLMKTIDTAVIITDRNGRIIRINPLAEVLTGWSNRDVNGKPYQRLFHWVSPANHYKGNDPVQSVLESESHSALPISEGLISKNGHSIPISGNVGAVFASNGELFGAVISFRDLSKEYILEQEIEGILNNSSEMIWVSDSHGNLKRVNQKFEEVLGYTQAEIVGQAGLVIIHQDDQQSVLAVLSKLEDHKTTAGFTCRFRCKDGSIKYINWKSRKNETGLVFTSARDVTDRRSGQGQQHQQANRDPLTGVYGEQFLNILIEEEIKRADFLHLPLSMAVLDVDNFKFVNETWGHPVGDDLLRMISTVSSNILRQSDIIIRLEGEKFLLLMPQTTVDGGKTAAEKVRTAIENNWHPIVGRQTVSIGVAERREAEPFTAWIERVEGALLQAKESGRNCVVTCTN